MLVTTSSLATYPYIYSEQSSWLNKEYKEINFVNIQLVI